MSSIHEKTIAVLVHNYFEQSEFETPLDALRSAGAGVVTISADKSKDLQAMDHASQDDKFQADLLLEDARAEDYDALVLPGGAINADHLRMVEKAQSWAIDFLDDHKLVAAICHAPWLLVSADAVEERRLTSYYTLQDDIENAGGEWTDRPVIIDDNLITSRGPQDLAPFCEAIIGWLDKQPRAKTAKL